MLENNINSTVLLPFLAPYAGKLILVNSLTIGMKYVISFLIGVICYLPFIKALEKQQEEEANAINA